MKFKFLILTVTLISSVSFAQDRVTRQAEVIDSGYNKDSKALEELKGCYTLYLKAMDQMIIRPNLNSNIVTKPVLYSESNYRFPLYSEKYKDWFVLENNGFFKFKNIKNPKLENNLDPVTDTSQIENLKIESEKVLERVFLGLSIENGWILSQIIYMAPYGWKGMLDKASLYSWRQAFCECKGSKIASNEIKQGIESLVHVNKVELYDLKTKDKRPLRESDFSCEFQAS